MSDKNIWDLRTLTSAIVREIEEAEYIKKTINVLSLSGEKIRVYKKNLSLGVQANIEGGVDFICFIGKSTQIQIDRAQFERLTLIMEKGYEKK